MNENIKIQGNKIKVPDKIWTNDKMIIIQILLIIHYSINLKSSYVPLNKVAYIYDMVKKNKELKTHLTLLSEPWDISEDLRKKLILAYDKKYIVIDEIQSTIRFCLTTEGKNLIDQIERLDLIKDLRLEIEEWSKSTKLNQLDNQNLMW